MSKSSSLLPRSLLSFLLLLVLTRAEPVVVPFDDCFSDTTNLANKFAVSTVYAQVLNNEQLGTFVNLTVFGSSPSEIVGLTNESSSLATLFTTTSILTLNAWTNSVYLCQDLRPASPLVELLPNTTYCPIAPGSFAFSSQIPWGNNRELTTLNTRLRAVDPFGSELVCIDVATTPLDPNPLTVYGKASIILWSTVALAAAYWFVVGIARVSTAWNRGIRRTGNGLWSKAQSAGFILASAVSGERLSNSPALLRFCTPSMRDVIFHTQWCALLGMVAVEWPQFAYPLLTQTAWSTLVFNVTLTSGARDHHWNPLFAPTLDPPAGFADQIADINSPLYIDSTVPNTLFTLPNNATHGISSFAYTLGIRPQDLFPTCLVLFLGIAAGIIVVSGLFWFLDVFVTSILQKFTGNTSAYGPTGRGVKSSGFGATTKEVETAAPAGGLEEDRSLSNGKGLGLALPSGASGNALSSSPSNEPRERAYHRSWWFFRFRSDIGSFHGNVLHGNLVRLLILFHLPVTVFSCYHMTLPRSVASATSVSLAALSFVIFSILLPGHLVLRVTFTSTHKLYDDMRTLLSLGPLYNHYRHGSQTFAGLSFATNIAFGVTIGAGQKSGTAQAIVILVVEVASALVTSIWLPWGTGASMGLISFLFCVARIVIAVLLVILTPTISVGSGPGGWVAYGIMLVLALVYLALVLLLVVKLVEAAIRIIGGIGFDRSRNVVDSGILGASGMLGCCGSRKKVNKNKNKKKSSKGKNAGGGNGRADKYKSSEMGESPSSLHVGSGLLDGRRNSDLSSYNPPAALLLAADGSDRGSITAPRFLGGADSRKGSTHSQPPSVLRPEHANQPYREETDREWWNENEGQGGAFIMGAWQPFGANGNPAGSSNVYNMPAPYVDSRPQISPQSQQRPSPQATTPSTGFSRVGGGRAHIDSPYAITPTGNTHSQSGLPNPPVSASTHAFPSLAVHSGPLVIPPPSAPIPVPSHPPPPAAGTPIQSSHHPSAASSYSPSSFHRHNAQPGHVDDDESAIPLSSVRPPPVQPQHHHHQNDFEALPPGAMPAHIRTKSQTAIIEDAGTPLYNPNAALSSSGGNTGSSSQLGISARLSLSNHPSLQPLKIPSSGSTIGLSPLGNGNQYPALLQPPPSAPPMFTLNAEEEDRDGDGDDDDSGAEDQQQKKKWYQLRTKKRPHSSEGRQTSTSTMNANVNTAAGSTTGMNTAAGSSSSIPLKTAADGEFGVLSGGGDGSGGTTPQRSFVVIRKPAGSMGRLNAPSSAALQQQAQRGATSPRSRPPTR